MELLPDLSSKEELIFQKLSWNPIHIDELCIQLKKDTPEVLSILLILELKKYCPLASGEIIYRICLNY